MHELSALQLLGLFGHFLGLSLLAVGGAITTTPDMHRYLVTQQGWLDDGQFTDAIALAQAAPGPNLLFVAVMGWNVAGAWGVVATMVGVLLPSTVLAYWASRWQGARREHRSVRAFTTGMAPLTIGLLLSTAWLLAEPALRGLWQTALAAGPSSPLARSLGSLLLMAFTVGATLRKQLSPLALVGIGAVLGALGWV